MAHQTLDATFDGTVFRPDEPPGIPPDTRCRISIEELPPVEATGDVWSLLGSLAGTVEAPEDWALEHDHYLYGGPKRHEDIA